MKKQFYLLILFIVAGCSFARHQKCLNRSVFDEFAFMDVWDTATLKVLNNMALSDSSNNDKIRLLADAVNPAITNRVEILDRVTLSNSLKKDTLTICMNHPTCFVIEYGSSGEKIVKTRYFIVSDDKLAIILEYQKIDGKWLVKKRMSIDSSRLHILDELIDKGLLEQSQMEEQDKDVHDYFIVTRFSRGELKIVPILFSSEKANHLFLSSIGY